MGKDDERFQQMCCHSVSDSSCVISHDVEDCKSPFGTYEISMPIDSKATCEKSFTRLTGGNCNDFDVRFEFHLLKSIYMSD